MFKPSSDLLILRPFLVATTSAPSCSLYLDNDPLPKNALYVFNFNTILNEKHVGSV